MIELRLNNHTIENNSEYPGNKFVTGVLSIHAANEHGLFTFILTAQTSNHPYVEWMMINVPDGDIENGETIVPLLSPMTLPTNKSQDYTLDVYRQVQNIPIQITEKVNPNSFHLNQIISPNLLEKYKTLNFIITPPEATEEYSGLPSPLGSLLEEPEEKHKELVPTSGYFLPNTPLNDKEQAYCRCVLHVAEKNSRKGNQEKAWYKVVDGKKTYNPYAVCTASVGTQSPCSQYYNFEGIPDDELIAYADLRNIEVPESREKLIQAIHKYLEKDK